MNRPFRNWPTLSFSFQSQLLGKMLDIYIYVQQRRETPEILVEAF